jgi:hypothetical protein
LGVITRAKKIARKNYLFQISYALKKKTTWKAKLEQNTRIKELQLTKYFILQVQNDLAQFNV